MFFHGRDIGGSLPARVVKGSDSALSGAMSERLAGDPGSGAGGSRLGAAAVAVLTTAGGCVIGDDCSGAGLISTVPTSSANSDKWSISATASETPPAISPVSGDKNNTATGNSSPTAPVTPGNVALATRVSSGDLASPSATVNNAPTAPVTPGNVAPATRVSPGAPGNIGSTATGVAGDIAPVGSATPAAPLRRSASDYVFGDEIGCGSFSSVYVARDVHTNRQVAVKVCVKRHILRERKHAYVVRERDILNHVSQRTSEHAPFFVQLFCTFHDQERLYFVLTFARRGDLLSHLTKVGTFDSDVVQFYTSELLMAVEHLHRIGVIHRDLKPENILLDARMHVVVSDFGSAKLVTHADCSLTQADLDCTNPLPCRPEGQSAQPSTPARNSFVGTAEYASPELLQEKTTSHASDLWALGCIIYQMVSGLPPFRSRSQYLVFRKILALEFEFPAEGFPQVSADLVRQLLVLEPQARLGARDVDWYWSVRRHAFFSGVQFESLHRQHPPEIYPFLPGTAEHPELRSTYRVPENLRPGLSERQLTCGLFNMALEPTAGASSQSQCAPLSSYRQCLQLEPAELQRRIEQQQQQNRWHRFVDNQLIVKQGFLEKRKGLFARRRMFLLTTGPRLFYVEPNNMVLKGEVPWSRELRPEAKNFRNFFVHTPGRTYYLEDTEGFALEWVKAIDEVRLHTYGDDNV